MKIDHHLGDALLWCFDPTVVSVESEMSTNGRLHARAVQDLALDLGCVMASTLRPLDGELLLVGGIRWLTVRGTSAAE